MQRFREETKLIKFYRGTVNQRTFTATTGHELFEWMKKNSNLKSEE